MNDTFKSALAGVAFLGMVLSSSAQAADYTTSSWAGLYVGGGLTVNFGDMEFPNGSVTTNVNGATTSGTNAGSETNVNGHVLGGYLFQMDRLIFGAEGDYTFGDSHEFGFPANYASCGVCAYAGGIGSLDPQGRVRAIVGLELDQTTMIFVAGGVAFADASFDGAYGIGVVNGNAAAGIGSGVNRSDTLVGYTAGGGFQVKATNNVLVRGEVLYDDYGGFSGFYSAAGSASDGNNSASGSASSNGSIDFTNAAARISVIWKFN